MYSQQAKQKYTISRAGRLRCRSSRAPASSTTSSTRAGGNTDVNTPIRTRPGRSTDEEATPMTLAEQDLSRQAHAEHQQHPLTKEASLVHRRQARDALLRGPGHAHRGQPLD